MASGVLLADQKTKERLTVISELLGATTEFFHKEGFLQLLPVILGKSTDPLGPDPGSMIVKTPEVEYLGMKLYSMNSMILHKQVAVRQLGKIFIMSPNIRLERGERKATGKHLFEFTQADFEIPDAKMEDVFSLMERYYQSLSARLERQRELFEPFGVEPFRFRTPFKRYTTHQLAEKYGDDWEIPASKDHDQPFWALCHKREFYDAEDLGDKGHYLNYDLVYPLGYGEALSGAQREWDYDRIVTRMGADKLNMEVYKAYLAEARKGFVRSAGAGFGIERLGRFLTRAEHVGDMQIFRRVPGEEVTI
jgi:asparaginyl-tRNA synthetase